MKIYLGQIQTDTKVMPYLLRLAAPLMDSSIVQVTTLHIKGKFFFFIFKEAITLINGIEITSYFIKNLKARLNS